MFNLVSRPAPKDVDFRLCQTASEIDWLFKSLAAVREYAWDIETTHPTRGKGKSDDAEIVETAASLGEKVVGVSFCWNDNVAAFLPLYKNVGGETQGGGRPTKGAARPYEGPFHVEWDFRYDVDAQLLRDARTWTGI
jgi:hypothetical protein